MCLVAPNKGIQHCPFFLQFGMALSNPLSGERRPGFVGEPLPGVEVDKFDSFFFIFEIDVTKLYPLLHFAVTHLVQFMLLEGLEKYL
jgi:hypothetical protein